MLDGNAANERWPLAMKRHIAELRNSLKVRGSL